MTDANIMEANANAALIKSGYDAFARGDVQGALCHTAFYRKRCLVCEGPIERSRDDQKICRKAKCRSAWRARTGLGRYIASSDAKLPSKKPVNKGAKGVPKRDPRSISWLVVAGPPEGISANAYHCAIVEADEL